MTNQPDRQKGDGLPAVNSRVHQTGVYGGTRDGTVIKSGADAFTVKWDTRTVACTYGPDALKSDQQCPITVSAIPQQSRARKWHVFVPWSPINERCRVCNELYDAEIHFPSATGAAEPGHEPLTKSEAEALLASAEAAQAKRAQDMPDEQSAINAMFNAWVRLKELGWNDIMYCPKDGSRFRVIENGSTGIFDCVYDGEWPKGHWTMFDEHDAYPSSIAPALYRLHPEDEAKRKQRMSEATAKFEVGNDETTPSSLSGDERNG
jgi:hypothetical protein